MADATTATGGAWARSLSDLAVQGWKARIEAAFRDDNATEFRLSDHELRWVTNVLVPILKREGLSARVARAQCGFIETDYYLCVYLQ